MNMLRRRSCVLASRKYRQDERIRDENAYGNSQEKKVDEEDDSVMYELCSRNELNLRSCSSKFVRCKSILVQDWVKAPKAEAAG